MFRPTLLWQSRKFGKCTKILKAGAEEVFIIDFKLSVVSYNNIRICVARKCSLANPKQSLFTQLAEYVGNEPTLTTDHRPQIRF